MIAYRVTDPNASAPRFVEGRIVSLPGGFDQSPDFAHFPGTGTNPAAAA
jgi:hypothetical protein